MSAIGRHDPAPSRIKYRLQRLWLTPIYRALIRTGLPVVVAFGLAVFHFQDPATQVKLAQSVTNARKMIEERPEFAVNLLRVDGATTPVAEQVRKAIPLEFPVSSLRLDFVALKQKIESIDAVLSADVFLRNKVLDIEVTERVPRLVWRSNGQISLLDDGGVQAGVIKTRMARPDLPLIVGLGAELYVKQAIEIIAAAGPISGRLRGLRRVGERRWDVVLDRGQTIQLPALHPVAALERVVALDRARDLLSRDVVLVDMRNGRRPIVRLSPYAVTELHKLRAIADGEDEL